MRTLPKESLQFLTPITKAMLKKSLLILAALASCAAASAIPHRYFVHIGGTFDVTEPLPLGGSVLDWAAHLVIELDTPAPVSLDEAIDTGTFVRWHSTAREIFLIGDFLHSKRFATQNGFLPASAWFSNGTSVEWDLNSSGLAVVLTKAGVTTDLGRSPYTGEIYRTRVPDTGATAALLGLGLLGIVAVSRSSLRAKRATQEKA